MYDLDFGQSLPLPGVLPTSVSADLPSQAPGAKILAVNGTNSVDGLIQALLHTCRFLLLQADFGLSAPGLLFGT